MNVWYCAWLFTVEKVRLAKVLFLVPPSDQSALRTPSILVANILDRLAESLEVPARFSPSSCRRKGLTRWWSHPTRSLVSVSSWDPDGGTLFESEVFCDIHTHLKLMQSVFFFVINKSIQLQFRARVNFFSRSCNL